MGDQSAIWHRRCGDHVEDRSSGPDIESEAFIAAREPHLPDVAVGLPALASPPPHTGTERALIPAGTVRIAVAPQRRPPVLRRCLNRPVRAAR